MAENFDSQSVGMRAQKKLLGKMASRKVVHAFIDDLSAQMLDDAYRIAKAHSDKKTAEKVIKDTIKVAIKTGILFHNGRFNDEERALAEDLVRKVQHVATNIIQFYRGDVPYDKTYLESSVRECGDLLKRIVRRHLTPKSLDRIDNVTTFFSNGELLDEAFQPTGSHRDLMGKIVQDLDQIADTP